MKPITPPTNVYDPNKEYKATYISDRMVKLDNGQIFSINVPGIVNSVVTVTIPQGRLAFPVAKLNKDYNTDPKKDRVNSLGQKVTYWGNAIANIKNNIDELDQNLYSNSSYDGVDTFGKSLTGNTPVEAQNGVRTTFTFQDRTPTAIPTITTFSEIIYLNGARLLAGTDYTITYSTGTVNFTSFIPIVTDVIIMDCHAPVVRPTDWNNSLILIY